MSQTLDSTKEDQIVHDTVLDAAAKIAYNPHDLIVNQRVCLIILRHLLLAEFQDLLDSIAGREKTQYLLIARVAQLRVDLQCRDFSIQIVYFE